MAETQKSQDEISLRKNRFQIGQGLGLIILGLAYLIWWIMPFAFEAYDQDPRWAHNWAYSIIILTVGLAWYYKSPVSRAIVTVQAFMLPVTASGSFNTLTMSFVTIIIAAVWAAVVGIERVRGKYFLEARLEEWTINWINLHTVILTWLLIAHMGLVFLIGRAPQEAQLLGFGTDAGFLAFLPPENHELATIFFDISLIILAIIGLYEQFKMGYNLEKKPWPRWSFRWIFICIGSGLLGLFITSI